ncbi:MAG: phosphoenolpyruvate--protein phosphotransferase [Planctomycetaceae bacterium]|nr:phosphoenolpyruvate--protein phosphotransferase [Planctomycetaceae bacterium]
MHTKHGIAVSPGVAIGPAFVLGVEDFRIPHRSVSVDAVDAEVVRFRCALEKACEEIGDNEKLASEQLGKQYGAIFGAHLQMARDPKLQSEVEALIREKHFSPEFALSRVLGQYAKVLLNLGDMYKADRAIDLYDLEKRLLRHLLGERREELANLTAPVIVLARDLTPSETASLPKQFVLGFATEVGGYTSHTAILAGALEIPAVVAVGDIVTDVSGGDTVILDGVNGRIIIDPDEETIQEYRDSEKRARSVAKRLVSQRSLTSETIDQERVWLMANIEFPEEAEHCNELGADGIGLYRTEFLYLESSREQSEEEHYEAYRQVVNAFPEQPVVIRTLDLGADKVPSQMPQLYPVGANPELGLRSIRLSLNDLERFKTQLRAILRAALLGDVRIMFPLISSVIELRQAKSTLNDVMEDLAEQGVPFNSEVQVGMMVEVPSVPLLAEDFAREVDFFSIGTNDLIQYTLAVDRSNPAVAKYYNSADPAILKMIRMVVEAGEKHSVPVTVCGQMSSDPKYIPLLVGLGIRHLSATPHVIPQLKEVVRHLTIPQAESIAAYARKLELARDIDTYLRGELNKLCPDLAK